MRKVKRLKKKERTRKFGFFIKFVFPVVLLVVVLGLFKLNTRFWDGKNKVSIAEQMADGSVAVKVFDPKLEEVALLTIPGDTQVSVSRNLGALRLKNVWQLGVNEKIGGRLLSETVTKNFLFPVFLFKGPDGKTNVPMGDRILIYLFEKKTKNLRKTEIDLGKSQFVKKGKLSDGEAGYILPGSVSERLTVYFIDNEFSDKPPKVYIKDLTGSFGVSDTVGKVVEVMGGKVVTIEKGVPEDSDCTLSGVLAKKVAKVFDCKVGKDSSGYDLEITLGGKFAKRF